ncbi:MAG TPA: peptide deformylase [Clostridia bacterium]|nr:peptide deformylase [Clostridia bacterium]
MVREILLLGDPRLYEKSAAVERDELPALHSVVEDLHDTLFAFREKFGCGRAIAAPQIGIAKRLVYMHIGAPVAFVNPVLSYPDGSLMEVMDDCMSFPHLVVRVLRYRRCRIDFMDLDWRPRALELEGDLSELLQHECDHLDGVLAVMRALDNKSFYYKP